MMVRNNQDTPERPLTACHVQETIELMKALLTNTILVHSSFESHNLIGPDEVIDFP